MNTTMQLGRWYVTSRTLVLAALVVAWFALLDLLTLLGYEVAVALLVASVGALAGSLLAYLGASSIKQSFARRFGSRRDAAAQVLALVSMLVILILGSYLTGSLALPSEEGGPSGPLIYGFALGFGSSIRHQLAPPPRSTPEEEREARSAEVRLLLVVGGAVGGLFALTFTVYVVFEYVLDPLVRLFAP